MFRPHNLFGLGWDCKEYFIKNLEFSMIHDTIVRMKGSQSNVVNEGYVVLWVPVKAVPVMAEGNTIHHVVDGCDDLQGSDDEEHDEQEYSILPQQLTVMLDFLI